MTVLAKFKCVSVDGPAEWKSIKLEAVIDGSEENKAFFRMTPSGQISLGCINPEANKQFEVGKEYFVNFIAATEDRPTISSASTTKSDSQKTLESEKQKTKESVLPNSGKP